MLRQRRGLIIGCLNYSSSYIEDFQANNNNKSLDSHASLLRQLMGLKTKFKVQLMQGTVKELRPSFMESFMFFVFTLGGRRGWGCIPQVLGRAALLETKCDRNVAVALENKSFRGRKRWEVVPDRNNKAGNNRAS